MVTEVDTISGLEDALRAKGEEFQTDLYEYVDDYMRVRARSKAGGLDHPPNVYVTVKLYGMYDTLKGRDTLTASDLTEAAISEPLAELQRLLVEHTAASEVVFEFKQYENGGAVTFDASLERAE